MTTWPAEFRRYERLASVAQVGGFRPPTTPRTSWIGQVLLGLPGEEWPAYEGRPMHGVCQIRVDELPARPPAPLDGVELVTIFVDLLELPLDAPNGAGWELRTYPSIEGLVPLLEPEREPVPERRAHEDLQVRPFPLLWRPQVELPSSDEPLSDADYDAFVEELWEQDGAPELNAFGLKVGGWPSTIQSEVHWSPYNRDRVEFVLQVASDEKSGVVIGDWGAAYFGWSAERGWVMEWQCH